MPGSNCVREKRASNDGDSLAAGRDGLDRTLMMDDCKGGKNVVRGSKECGRNPRSSWVQEAAPQPQGSSS